MLIAALLTDGGADGFNTVDAWRFVTYLTIGYMISRGLAKAGSRNPREDQRARKGPGSSRSRPLLRPATAGVGMLDRLTEGGLR